MTLKLERRHIITVRYESMIEDDSHHMKPSGFHGR